MLHRALTEQSSTQTISFTRLYPHWLYPGSGPTALTPQEPREPNVEYVIDAYNPLTLRDAVHRIVVHSADLAIFDWWTLFWSPGVAYMARRLRQHGVRTLFICHNVFDHKTSGFTGAVDTVMSGVSKLLLRQADAYLVQSDEQRTILATIKPGADTIRRIHPIYTMLPAPSRQFEARGTLELLFFGFIRPYKGLDLLLQAVSDLHDDGVYLTIVGEPWGDTSVIQRQIEAAGIPNVEAILSYVSDQEAADYLSRADAVVLPYRSATGSGVASLAYNFGKPVIATRVGGLTDTIVHGETGVLVAPESSSALREAIGSVTREQLRAMRPAIERLCADNSWDALARLLADVAASGRSPLHGPDSLSR